MKMSGVLFLALFAALGVSLSEGKCQGEVLDIPITVLPSRCWYFCRRHYGKGGACEENTENARCICDGSGDWLDVGSCSKDRQPNGEYVWISDCNGVCQNEYGRVLGGECSWSLRGKKCFCRNSDNDRDKYTTAAPL